jgi:dihydropteroate synthase
MQSKVFSTNKTLNLRGKVMDLTIPKVMGILNVTPDSFYDGGRFTTEKSILEQVEKMLFEGADLIDVGGYSTRPGASDIAPEVELTRILPVIEMILKHFKDTALSVDTFRAETARQAVLSGACMINDISGGGLDSTMFETVAHLKVPYILMHMRGTPQTMNHLTKYEDPLGESIDYFHLKIKQLHDLNVADIIIDPGFGFAKTADQSFGLLQHLDYFKILGQPIIAGLSRKSMVWRTLTTKPAGALNGTTTLNTIALINGASILRVHDVREAVESIRLIQKTQAPAITDNLKSMGHSF